MQALFLDLILISGLLLLGSQLVRAILRSPGFLEYLSLSFPLGGGILTWLVFMLSLAGLPISISSMSIVYAATLLGLTIYNRILLPKQQREPESVNRKLDLRRRIRSWQTWAWAGFVLLLATAAAMSVGRSYSTYDATAGWAIKGYGIALEGTVRAGDRWGLWALAYPLNIPLQIGAFQLFSGDLLAGSKLIFPLFFASLLIGCYRFWRRSQVGEGIAFLGMFFLASNPLIFLHGTMGFANLPFACYFTLGALWAIEGIHEENDRSMILSGILLGLASWTRAEGIGYCLALILALLIAKVISRHGRLRMFHWLLPLAVVAASWLVFSWTAVEQSHLGEAMGGVLPRLLDGQLNLFEIYLVPRIFLERALQPANWGLFIPVTGFLILLGIGKLRPRRYPKEFSALLAAIATAAMPFGLFSVRSFTRSEDFIELLIRSFDRAFLPAGFMIMVLALLLSAGGAKPFQNYRTRSALNRTSVVRSQKIQ